MSNLANMSPQAIAAWQRLNELWGKPIPISSSYRDPETNRRVGGAKGSQHLHGNAFDIPTAGMSPQEIDALIKAGAKAGFRGFGGYGGSVHFDVGPQRTWGPDYSSKTTPEYLKSALSGAEFSSMNFSNPTMSTKGGGTMTPDQMTQEPEQPRGLLGNLFGNPDAMASLAIAFNSMRLNPDPAIAQLMGAQMKERRQERQQKAELNKTVEMLRRIGADPRLIELAQAGYAKEAIAQAYAKPKQNEPKIVEVGGRLVRVDPTTGAATEIYSSVPGQAEGSLTKDQMTALNSLRDDLRTELKPFEIVKQGYNNISTFYNNPGSTSDYALAVAFAKILDPGSVAREGEVAAVQNAGARVPALGQALKNAITGEGALTPAVRQEIADLATKIYQERVGEAQSTIEGYSEIARRGNLPPELLYSGNIPQPRKVIPAAVPKAAADQGVTQEMWDRATPEEKQAWMN